MASKLENTPKMENKLEAIHHMLDEMQTIKDEEDVVGMVRQWTLSPNSEFVKAGIEANDLIDASSKYVYYTYLTEVKHISPDEAMKEVIKGIPDYKEDMPSNIKLLSDYGIIMFPSFWARIQQANYLMATKRPVSLLGMFGIEDYLGVHIESIWDANLYEKATTFGGILHTPLDSIGYGSLYSTNMWNF
jgi:hypothetical protein